jgi:hypothetical protein
MAGGINFSKDPSCPPVQLTFAYIILEILPSVHYNAAAIQGVLKVIFFLLDLFAAFLVEFSIDEAGMNLFAHRALPRTLSGWGNHLFIPLMSQ